MQRDLRAGRDTVDRQDGGTRGPQVSRFHWPALDGLRGVAVVAVILFHARSTLTPNGFSGVDVFFGLSGFLITALLLREHHLNRRISLRQFYVRRILRLYPALVVAGLGVMALAVVADNVAEGGPAVLAALFYVAHLWIYTGHDGWLLEHTWTLSLEEHYYLFWPSLVALLLAGRRWRWLGIALAIFALMLLATPWFLPEGIRAAYERGAPMIYGSLAAMVWWRVRDVKTRKWMGWVGTAALITLISLTFWPQTLSESWLTGVNSLPGVLSVVAVASFIMAPRGLGARCLDWSPLKWTGRRAYGLYLYHFPILSVLAHHIELGVPNWANAIIGVVLSFAVAAASYRWVELPFLRRKARFSPTD